MGIGALMLLSAVMNAWSTHRFIKSARRANGVVKELSHGPAHPLIEFHLPSGEAHEFPANGWISYAKGNSVQVLYALDDEGLPDARLNDGGDLWYAAVSRSGLGLVFLIVGVVIRIRSGGS